VAVVGLRSDSAKWLQGCSMDVTDMVVEAIPQADPGMVRTIFDTAEIYACRRRSTDVGESKAEWMPNV
jgi:hypothetical protein